jgi:GT2 family glycosyltransferase
MGERKFNKMIGIVLTCYERPEYLKHTLECLENTLMYDNHIVVLDDASISLEVKDLIRDFRPNCPIDYLENEERKGVSQNLLRGFEILKKYGFKTMMNIDSDVDLKDNWIKKITDLLERFPDRICTGFNANNTSRFPVCGGGDDYWEKQQIGGINIAFTEQNYDKVIEALQPEEKWQKGNAWDWHLVDIMMKEGKTFIVTKPGVIQHIGLRSTLGHKGGDIDLNFNKDE